MTSKFSWQNCYSFTCFILYSKAKFACYSCYSRYLVTSYFCIPVPYNEKDIFFGVLILEGVEGLHKTVQLQFLQHQWLENIRFVMLNGLPWKQTKIIQSFLRLHPGTAFWTLVDCEGYSISSKGFLPTVVDVTVI